MDPRISIITLGVTDLDPATTFSRDGLDLPELESDGDIAFFDTQGTRLALYPRDELAADATVDPATTGFDGITLAHNVHSEHAVDALIDDAETAGATIVKHPQDTSWGGYSGYFADPDDHLWEIAYNPHFDIQD